MVESKFALVVDDSLVNRKLALAFLQKLGWEGAAVESGQAALDWLEDNPAIDLMLLDISMPGLTGEEVCQRLRTSKQFSALPIIAYTAHAMTHDVDRFLSIGFDTVLLKPNSLQDMQDAITKALAAAV